MPEQLLENFWAGLESVGRLSLWLTVLVAIFVPLERLFAAHPKRIFRKGFGTDLCYYFLNSLLVTAVLSLPIALLAWLVRHAIPDSYANWASSLPVPARVAIGFVAGEVGYYWGHRISHEVPFLWRFHSIHHSAEHIDFLVNTRAHPIDMVFGRFCGLVPIYLLCLGGPTEKTGTFVPVLASLISTVWGFFIHANLNWRFGPLEWVISTPAFHHWHHTKTPVNRNYSSTLPWLDRIFGTYHLPNEFPAEYGIKAKMPDSILDQLAYPLDAELPTSRSNPPAENPPPASNSADSSGSAAENLPPQ